MIIPFVQCILIPVNVSGLMSLLSQMNVINFDGSTVDGTNVRNDFRNIRDSAKPVSR